MLFQQSKKLIGFLILFIAVTSGFGQTESAMLFIVVMGTVWAVLLATGGGFSFTFNGDGDNENISDQASAAAGVWRAGSRGS